MKVRTAALAITLATLLVCAGCGLPGLGAPAPSGTPTAGPFTDTAALAGAMRTRQLSDRTVSYSTRLTYEGDQGYSGEGALVITEGSTDSRFRVALSDGPTGEIVTIGSDVFSSATEITGSSASDRPWQRSSLDESPTTSSPHLYIVVLTQLDSLDEAFVLRGSSAEVRGDRRVVEYRMTADYLEGGLSRRSSISATTTT